MSSSAPVQADRTGDSINALNKDIGEFLGTKGVTGEEFEPDHRQPGQRAARPI